jgi:hypothetical protein
MDPGRYEHITLDRQSTPKNEGQCSQRFCTHLRRLYAATQVGIHDYVLNKPNSRGNVVRLSTPPGVTSTSSSMRTPPCPGR